MSILSGSYNAELEKEIEELIFSFTQEHGGTISAELGCGFRYRNFNHYSKSLIELNLMRSVKSLIDPKGILNPYKVIPDQIA